MGRNVFPWLEACELTKHTGQSATHVNVASTFLLALTSCTVRGLLHRGCTSSRCQRTCDSTGKMQTKNTPTELSACGCGRDCSRLRALNRICWRSPPARGPTRTAQRQPGAGRQEDGSALALDARRRRTFAVLARAEAVRGLVTAAAPRRGTTDPTTVPNHQTKYQSSSHSQQIKDGKHFGGDGSVSSCSMRKISGKGKDATRHRAGLRCMSENHPVACTERQSVSEHRCTASSVNSLSVTSDSSEEPSSSPILTV